MFKTRFYNLSLVVLFITIILLVWGGCEKNAQLSAFKSQIVKFKKKEQFFTQRFDKNKRLTTEQNQIILSQKDALKTDLLILNDFKNVESQVKIITITKIDSIYVPFQKTDTIFSNNTFTFKDEYFGIYGCLNKDGILFDSVYFVNDMIVTIGNKSKGFFKKTEPIVEIKYENPYSRTTSTNNVIIKNELKWYDQKKTWFFIGGFLGAFTTLILIP